ncbi:MAG: protease pro-enzyme activation domain-containing protein [Verrucomicrobiota bacterium]|jgi:hypothetical protein
MMIPTRFRLAALLFILALNIAGAAPQRRLLTSHIPPGPATGGLRWEPTNRVNLLIGLPLSKPAELETFLRQIYNPASSNFHHYVTSQQFTDRFGPTSDDYQKVIAFAERSGFAISVKHAGRMVLEASASSADVVDALGNVHFTGILGDGNAVCQSAVVSEEGLWPFYIPLYSGNGIIYGWLQFANVSGIQGQLNWIKWPHPGAKSYPDGFWTTNTVQELPKR